MQTHALNELAKRNEMKRNEQIKEKEATRISTGNEKLHPKQSEANEHRQTNIKWHVNREHDEI